MHPWALGFGLCLEVGAATYAGAWIGRWVDGRYGTGPYGVAIGVVLFLAVSVYHLIFMLRMQEKSDKNRPQ